jgi:hypothetical protein
MELVGQNLPTAVEFANAHGDRAMPTNGSTTYRDQGLGEG